MSPGSPVLQAPDRRRGDWVLGALFVIVVGLVSLAVSLGLAVAFHPLLEAVGAFVAGRDWPAWILAVVSFLFFDVLRFGLFWGGISLVWRPHGGRFIRYFLGFPVVAFALFLSFTWPDSPSGLPVAATQAYQTLRILALGVLLIALVVSLVYSRTRKKRA
ncbi:MAG: hypothetical protein ACYC6T_02440 [Thermoleophilia bacterium]